MLKKIVLLIAVFACMVSPAWADADEVLGISTFDEFLGIATVDGALGVPVAGGGCEDVWWDRTATTSGEGGSINSGVPQTTKFTSSGTQVSAYKVYIDSVSVAGDISVSLYADNSDAVGDAVADSTATVTAVGSSVVTATLSSPVTISDATPY